MFIPPLELQKGSARRATKLWRRRGAFGALLSGACANVPVVLIGEAAAARRPMRAIRIAAAGIFILLGVLTIVDFVNLEVPPLK